MTQIDARNAVQHVKRNLENALKARTFEELSAKVFDVMMDVDTLEQRLSERKQAAPNCRPATPEELRQLCASSNVVFWSPAA